MNPFKLLTMDWKNAKTATVELDPILREKLTECDNKNFEIYAGYFENLVKQERERRKL